MKTCWIIIQYEEPFAVIKNEADAESYLWTL